MPQKSSEKSISASDISILVIGTTCCDMINPNFDFLDDIAGDGLVVDTRRMVAVQPEWLEFRKDSYAMGGGSLNIAPLVSLAGVPAGIMTSLGRENKNYDIHGKFILDIIKKTGTCSAIFPHDILPSGASFIRPAHPGRREAILHAPNAVDDLDIENENVFTEITKLLPGAIIHFVYSGLAKTMDSEGGAKLARVMERLKGSGYITMADPHTLSKDPEKSIRTGEIIHKYKLLEPVLPHLSWFFASEAEAMMIANTFGVPLKGKKQKERNNEFLQRLADAFCLDNSPRLFGITAGTDVYILSVSPEGNRTGPISVKSRYVITEADKFVGAGDSFRAGFHVAWAGNSDYSEKFKAGQIKEADLRRLCLMGHLMAACYVTRFPSNQYGNIPTYQNMKKVIDSGKTFSKKEALLSALGIKNCLGGSFY